MCIRTTFSSFPAIIRFFSNSHWYPKTHFPKPTVNLKTQKLKTQQSVDFQGFGLDKFKTQQSVDFQWFGLDKLDSCKYLISKWAVEVHIFSKAKMVMINLISALFNCLDLKITKVIHMYIILTSVSVFP